jgi:NADH dehydrogenase (ubiquinone) 1 alpha subcomplex subunit 9
VHFLCKKINASVSSILLYLLQVGDVAEGIVQAIKNPDMVGKNIECVGPQRYYLADIVDYIIQVLRRADTMKRTDRTYFLRLKAGLMDKNPATPWFNHEKVEMEGITDWTTPGNPTLEDLGVSLTQFDIIARYVLYPHRRFSYYSEKLGEFADPVSPKPADFYQPKTA